ncbi:hypothetical protein FRC16_007767, partial [Serendipita sp. 398]
MVINVTLAQRHRATLFAQRHAQMRREPEGSVMNKLKGVTSGGSSNSPGNQNTAPVMYIPAPNQMQQTMQPMQMQQQQQQPQQMMIAQQPVMMMQQPQQAPQAMMMVSQPQPVQQHQPHQGHHHASMQVAVMIASPPPPQNCLYAGCTNKSYVDPSTGMPSKYCSKAHKQLAETCQFPNCGKPVYADPKTGKKGQFCSRSHANAAKAAGQNTSTGSPAPTPNQTVWGSPNNSTASSAPTPNQTVWGPPNPQTPAHYGAAQNFQSPPNSGGYVSQPIQSPQPPQQQQQQQPPPMYGQPPMQGNTTYSSAPIQSQQPPPPIPARSPTLNTYGAPPAYGPPSQGDGGGQQYGSGGQPAYSGGSSYSSQPIQSSSGPVGYSTGPPQQQQSYAPPPVQNYGSSTYPAQPPPQQPPQGYSASPPPLPPPPSQPYAAAPPPNTYAAPPAQPPQNYSPPPQAYHSGPPASSSGSSYVSPVIQSGPQQQSSMGLASTYNSAPMPQTVPYCIRREMATVQLMLKQRSLIKPAFLVCDIQERFRSAIYGFPALVQTSKRMIEFARLLKVPVIATEQNPRALGSTVEELDLGKLGDLHSLVSFHFLRPAVVKAGTFPKTKFSMVIPEVQSKLQELGTQSVVIFGIESHVCVFQTVLELLEAGYSVHVVADAVSSCNKEEVPLALASLRQAGAVITTSESLAFQLMGDANSPSFKEFSALVKAEKQHISSS